MLAQLTFKPQNFSFNHAVDEVLELMEKRGDDKETLRKEVDKKIEDWKEIFSGEQKKTLLSLIE